MERRELGFELKLFREDGEMVGKHGEGVSRQKKIPIVKGMCYNSAAELIFKR